MSSSRPYLLRALYEWICDDGLTPHLLVRVDSDRVRVPTPYVKDGQITLNVAPSAVRDLQMTNAGVRFSARFGGAPMMVDVPIANVMAVFARESGQGMVFGAEPGDPEPPDPQDDEPAGRPALRVVK